MSELRDPKSLRERVRVWQATGMAVTIKPETVNAVAKEIDAMQAAVDERIRLTTRYYHAAVRADKIVQKKVAKMRSLARTIILVTLLNVVVTAIAIMI